MEWSRQATASLRLLANLSWIDRTTDTRGFRAEFGASQAAADWMGNLALFWKVAPQTLFTARWNYVGDRPPENENGYGLFDLVLSRRDLFAPGLTVRAMVKNAFDDDVFYIQESPTGAAALQFPGRSVLLQAVWNR